MTITKPDIKQFLVPQCGTREVNLAENQHHLGYETLPVIRTADGKVASQWLPTPNELLLLNMGVPVTVVAWTFNRPPAPITVMVGGADLR
jgi:hypothetical protein